MVPHSGHSSSRPASLGSHSQVSATTRSRRPCSVTTYRAASLGTLRIATDVSSVSGCRHSAPSRCDASVRVCLLAWHRSGALPWRSQGGSNKPVTDPYSERRGSLGACFRLRVAQLAACTLPWGSAPNPEETARLVKRNQPGRSMFGRLNADYAWSGLFCDAGVGMRCFSSTFCCRL